MKKDHIRSAWEAFVTEYKEYFLSDDEQWNITLTKVKEFIDKNKKRPSAMSKNKDEKVLGMWISTQTQNYKKSSMKKDHIRSAWEAFVTEYKEYFTRQKRAPKKMPQISELHKKYKTMSSENLHKLFTESPQLWHEYHKLADLNENTRADDEIPHKKIIKYLSDLQFTRTKYIGDLGCGQTKVYNHFKDDERFKIYNYDHHSISNNVVKCDIKNVPLGDNTLNIAILCLALWGSNCIDYVKEAHRILEQHGTLLIIEPTKRWMKEVPDTDDLHNTLLNKVEACGFSIRNNYFDKFIFIEASKK